MCKLTVLRENWHALVRKPIEINGGFNRTRLDPGIRVR